MKITNKILSLSLICFMMICLCGCEAESDDKNTDDTNLTLWAMRGTWTTVACSNVPSSMNIVMLANASFWLDTDYDGGERWFDIWSRVIGDYDDVNLNGLTIETDGGSPILDIISFKESIMDVRVSKFSNAILTMKKLNSGLINDDDYKFKLTNGVWIKYYYDDAFCEEYSNDSDLKSMAKMYGDGGRLINFHQNGTGEFAYKNSGMNRVYDYTFDWKLEDKVLTIQIEGKEARQSKVSLVGVEGEIYIRFGTDIFWDE